MGIWEIIALIISSGIAIELIKYFLFKKKNIAETTSIEIDNDTKEYNRLEQLCNTQSKMIDNLIQQKEDQEVRQDKEMTLTKDELKGRIIELKSEKEELKLENSELNKKILELQSGIRVREECKTGMLKEMSKLKLQLLEAEYDKCDRNCLNRNPPRKHFDSETVNCYKPNE